jgi:hypothetical protein
MCPLTLAFTMASGLCAASGRPDLNRRPLDPQNGGVGVLAAQSRPACRTRRAATCGLFSRMCAVWSPRGPQEEDERRHFLLRGLT